MKKVYIMIGVAGSGKSTWGKNNAKDFVHCSADNYFMKSGSYNFDFTKLGAAHGSCLRMFKEAIDKGECAIVDNTNTRVKEIRPYYDYAIQNGYEVNLVFVSCDPKVAAQRNLHSVPEDKVQEMYDRIKNMKIPDDWKVNVITT